MQSIPPHPRVLADALRGAAEAHHIYEQETGQPDPNWADWYAQYVAENWAIYSEPGPAIHRCPRHSPLPRV